MKRKTVFTLLGIILMLGTVIVLADTQFTKITFVIPSSVSHSLAYGGACDENKFFFVENDGSYQGTQARINVTSDNVGWTTSGTGCQDGEASIVITNSGTVAVNMSVNTSAAFPAGTGLKVALADAGYEADCTDTVSTTTCADVIYGTAVNVSLALAPSVTRDLYFFGNMSDFNSGVAVESEVINLTTHAKTGP